MKQSKHLQALEWLEKEKRKDVAAIKAEKEKFIHEIKNWDKQTMFPQVEEKKIGFLDKLKRILGK
jgi:hypothetical protein